MIRWHLSAWASVSGAEAKEFDSFAGWSTGEALLNRNWFCPIHHKFRIIFEQTPKWCPHGWQDIDFNLSFSPIFHFTSWPAASFVSPFIMPSGIVSHLFVSICNYFTIHLAWDHLQSVWFTCSIANDCIRNQVFRWIKENRIRKLNNDWLWTYYRIFNS